MKCEGRSTTFLTSTQFPKVSQQQLDMMQKLGVIVGNNPAGLYIACRLARCYHVEAFVSERFEVLLDSKQPKALWCKSPWRWSKSHLDALRETPYGPGTTLTIRRLDTDSKEAVKGIQLAILCCEPTQTKQVVTWVRDQVKTCRVIVSLQTGLDHNSDITEILKDTENNLNCIMGCTGVHASVVETTDKLTVYDCVLGAVVLSRLGKDLKGKGVDFALDVVEHTGLPVLFRYSRQIRNYMWGDIISKSLLPLFYIKTLSDQSEGDEKQESSKSIYQMLLDSRELRLAIVSAINESLESLKGQRTDYIDPASSPLWMGFKMTRWVFRLSDGWFAVVFRLWFKVFKAVSIMNFWGPACVDWETCVSQVDKTTGEIIKYAAHNNVQVALHEHVHEYILQNAKSKHPSSKEARKVWAKICSTNPSTYPWFMMWILLSILVGLVSVIVPFLWNNTTSILVDLFW